MMTRRLSLGACLSLLAQPGGPRSDASARALFQLQRQSVSGPIYYNPGYAQYGLPGVGVSPWNPIVQAQLNLGMRTARYNMYSAWADQSNAAANLFYQQAVTQQIQNPQATQAMQTAL